MLRIKSREICALRNFTSALPLSKLASYRFSMHQDHPAFAQSDKVVPFSFVLFYFILFFFLFIFFFVFSCCHSLFDCFRK